MFVISYRFYHGGSFTASGCRLYLTELNHYFLPLFFFLKVILEEALKPLLSPFFISKIEFKLPFLLFVCFVECH